MGHLRRIFGKLKRLYSTVVGLVGQWRWIQRGVGYNAFRQWGASKRRGGGFFVIFVDGEAHRWALTPSTKITCSDRFLLYKNLDSLAVFFIHHINDVPLHAGVK